VTTGGDGDQSMAATNGGKKWADIEFAEKMRADIIQPKIERFALELVKSLCDSITNDGRAYHCKKLPYVLLSASILKELAEMLEERGYEVGWYSNDCTLEPDAVTIKALHTSSLQALWIRIAL
jgi:hypothetical protein